MLGSMWRRTSKNSVELVYPVKASDKIEEGKKDEAEELYSPVTRDKINNADSGVSIR